MQIESGKLYINKTWLYLYPCLKYYGEDLRNHLNSFLKIGAGISDHNLNIDNGSNNIFILFDLEPKLPTPRDSENYKENFNKFLDWLRYQYFYVTDYVFEELKHSGKHMIVLKIPHIHDKALISYIQGRYSEMYSEKEVNSYFTFVTIQNKDKEAIKNARIKKTRNVLLKNKEILPDFVKEVNEKYKSEVTLEDFTNAELDFPPTLEEETFNY